MIRLSVWLRTSQGVDKRAGEIRVTDPDAARGGALRGEFRSEKFLDAAPAGSWRLAPAYDLTPDEPPRGEHVLHFGAAGHRPDAAALLRLARSFGLSAVKGRRIHAEVAEAFSGWRALFLDHGVPAGDQARLAPDIERRLCRCAKCA